MRLNPHEWYMGYAQILADCRQGGSALLLANADVDAMCAARILSYMLRADGVSYQLYPCMSYSQLTQTLQNKMADTVCSIVLLNLGASRNLTTLFEDEIAPLHPSIKIYVMDCRRPVHLANVHAESNVVVFWEQNDEDIPSDGDNLSGNDSSSSESNDDESEEENSDEEEEEAEFDDAEGEAEFLGDEIVGENPQEPEEAIDKIVAGDEQDPDYDGEDEMDKVDSSSKNKKRDRAGSDESNFGMDPSVKGDNAGDETEPTAPSTQQPTTTPRELHENRRNRLTSYYSSGTFYGSPAAYVAYTIASELRFNEIGDLLWLACVGVTDAYLLARLDKSGYAELTVYLREQCNRLFPNDMYHRVESAVYAEHLTGRSEGDNPTLTKIGFSENGRIFSEADFRFFLLRHTSLFDAMVYSDFISTRFQLSTSRGMHKLQELLAKMGYPLEECHQPFAFMKPKLRRRLQVAIRDHAEDYGLEDFEFTSFFRITGFQSLLSACDTSYAVTALLEFERPALSTKKSSSLEEQADEELVQAFNNAYDALNSNVAPTVTLNGLTGEGADLMGLVNGGNLSGSTGLGAGIRLAMSLQRSIMATAASLIDRNAITRLSHFRYAYITCTSQGENQGPGGNEMVNQEEKGSEAEMHHIFAKPLALARLAHYLMDLHRENGKWTGAKSRPLILMAEKPRTKTCLVVGYMYAESAGHSVNNRFGKNFELAAQSMEGTFRFDSFDSNVVEVNRDDVQRFIEQLHYLLDYS